ncbi:MAG: hypothetical protein D6820_04290 [Lentisphaerae bacterium]|nr:MAG: hypothetical protein D6820_04290 [Lentisphaerota bacterium]
MPILTRRPVILLAVDAGLRCGLAGYGPEGQLQYYASRHFRNKSVMKKAIFHMLNEFNQLQYLVVEGAGDYALAWEHEAQRRGLTFQWISAETWRKAILLQRERRTGKKAKHHADALAREIIRQHGAKRPTSLRHDVAEAILIGYWATAFLRTGSDRGQAPT